MRIKKIQIQNFKSLINFELKDLKQFCAFVGPNASGKSNIFEALEFTNYAFKYSFDASSFFGGRDSIYSYNPISIPEHDHFKNGAQSYYYEFGDGIIIDFFLTFSQQNNTDSSDYFIGTMGSKSHFFNNNIEQLNALDIRNISKRDQLVLKLKENEIEYENDYEQFADRFSRIFIKKLERRFGSPSLFSQTLLPDASNLAQVLGKIFEDENKKDDFVEWLSILIPEFKNIQVKKSNLDGRFDFFIYEKSSDRPFSKHLISDGTYNILSLMAAVYQTDLPQFLCIEEPENGLHPQAIKTLIDFFKEKCETEGHYIWLNTHSQSLVECLEIDDLILVNKINGRTIVKQLEKGDKLDIKTDEAWLTNALGGGTLWSM